MSEAGDQTQVQEPTPVEKEARIQGWVPKEEFRGNEADWIDADTFVQRGREINPILRKNNERIQRELDATKRQMEDLKKATEEFKAFQKEAYARKLADYELEIADLKDLKRKAVTEGDGALVVELDDKIDAVKAQKAAEKAPVATTTTTEPQVDPQVQKEIQEWVDRNDWYNKDPKMAAAANSIAAQLRQTNPFLVGKEFMDLLDKDLEDMFPPEKLGKQSRPRSPVSGTKQGTTTQTRGGDKSYDKLPPEAKAACDKFVKQKLMTKEEYVASYDWS